MIWEMAHLPYHRLASCRRTAEPLDRTTSFPPIPHMPCGFIQHFLDNVWYDSIPLRYTMVLRILSSAIVNGFVLWRVGEGWMLDREDSFLPAIFAVSFFPPSSHSSRHFRHNFIRGDKEQRLTMNHGGNGSLHYPPVAYSRGYEGRARR